MDHQLQSILLRTREFILESGIRQLNTANLAKSFALNENDLLVWFPTQDSLVEKVLEFERNSFKAIFEENNFEDTNAIEILMIVSKAMSTRFLELAPSVTSDLEALYPEIYHRHIEQRIEFIFMKMKINIEKGIRQGIYREDLSIELLARLYISRLIDLHNPAFFPPEKFSFKVLYEVMIDNFIRGIANDNGLVHYKKLRKSYKMC